jgi:hypothetical protein
MKFSRKLCTTLLLCAFVSINAKADNKAAPAFCEQLKAFSTDLKIDQSRSITFFVRHVDILSYQRVCKQDKADDKSRAFCDWLSKNSSGEFMAANVTRALACVTGSTNFFGKATEIEELKGKLTAFEPFQDMPDIIIDFKYSFDVRAKDEENYFTITTRRVKLEED